MIIYLSQISPRGRSRSRGTVMRRYPRINRTGCPSSVLSCTAWGFSCLANCSASGELLPRLFTLACLVQRTGGIFSVTLSVNVHFRERRPRIVRGMLPYGVRTFLQQVAANAGLTSDHLPSLIPYHKLCRKKESHAAREMCRPNRSDVITGQANLLVQR